MAKKQKKGSLIYQMSQKLNSMRAYGRSKRAERRRGPDGRYKSDGIYSIQTMRNYHKYCGRYLNWVRQNYPGVKDLAQAEQYLIPYLRSREFAHELAATTQKAHISGLQKLYPGAYLDYVRQSVKPNVAEYTKSRRKSSDELAKIKQKYPDTVHLLEHTGLRRSELAKLTGKDLIRDDQGRLCIRVERSKGGRSRLAPVIGSAEDMARIETLFKGREQHLRLFAKVPKAIDTNYYRGQYAQAMYQELERPLDELKRSDKLYRRGLYKGDVYDKLAIHQVSLALGHGRAEKPRYDVILKNYFTK